MNWNISAWSIRTPVPPLVLFMVVFFWTPPHFWSLAIRYRDDYAAAQVPMLPDDVHDVEGLRRLGGHLFA